jgi:hypothetical protein
MAKVGTVPADVRAIHAALTELKPPAHLTLREQDLPFWKAIVNARARDTWTDIDLAHAANLARTQADIEVIQQELDVEGFTCENFRGTVTQNPKFSILETLSRRAVLLSKALQVHATATVGESRDQIAKNKVQAKVLRNEILDEGDDLIAPPVH